MKRVSNTVCTECLRICGQPHHKGCPCIYRGPRSDIYSHGHREGVEVGRGAVGAHQNALRILLDRLKHDALVDPTMVEVMRSACLAQELIR